MGRIVDFVLFLYAVTPLAALVALKTGGSSLPPKLLAGILLYSVGGTIASAYLYFRYGRNQQRSLSGRLLELVGGLLLILFFLVASLFCALVSRLSKTFSTRDFIYVST